MKQFQTILSGDSKIVKLKDTESTSMDTSPPEPSAESSSVAAAAPPPPAAPSTEPAAANGN